MHMTHIFFRKFFFSYNKPEKYIPTPMLLLLLLLKIENIIFIGFKNKPETILLECNSILNCKICACGEFCTDRYAFK